MSNDKVLNKQKAFILYSVIMCTLGVMFMVVGILDTLEPESIIRNIVYAFGEGVGRGFIIILGLFMITFSAYMFRLSRSGLIK